MLSWRNATMPPASVIANRTSINTRCLRAKPISAFMATDFRSDRPRTRAAAAQPSRPNDVSISAAGRHAIDEQAAFGDHPFARLHAVQHLHHASAGEAGPHLPQ